MSHTSSEPLIIGDQGSFFVGGRSTFLPHATGPDGFRSGSGRIIVDQTYVSYQIPAERRRRVPVIMVHGGVHTGKTYETTPDGCEGWATYFLRRGMAVYVVDMATRGRSSFDATQVNLVHRGLAQPATLPNMVTMTKERAWVNFRFGPELGVPFPGTQFPVEAADQYFSQIVSSSFPDQPNNPSGSPVPLANVQADPAYAAGLIALLDKIGPSILITHSQSARVGWQTAAARPDLVRGVIDVEGSCVAPDGGMETIARIPIRVIYGDFTDIPPVDDLWGPGIALAKDFIAELRSLGGVASLDFLPGASIRGNSHMMMMDKNNLVIADRIINWLHSVGIGEPEEEHIT